MLALQTLIKLLTEELKQTVVPLSAEESDEARKAAYAATEADDAPAGSPEKRPKVKTEAPVTPSAEVADDLSIPPFMDRTHGAEARS
jgi:hypothetical protein